MFRGLATVLLLVVSNAFMTLAWYGHIAFKSRFSIWELKVIQEVVSLSVFTVFALVFMKSDTLRWNHLAGFLCLVLAVYFIFRK